MCAIDYDGPRTAKGIVDYVLMRMPSFVKKVGTAQALEELRKQVSLHLSNRLAWTFFW